MRFLLVDVEGNREVLRREVPVEGTAQTGRVQFLQELGIEVVVCCAVTRRLQVELEACGIRVMAHTCGLIDDVVTAYLQDRLSDEVFRMPGCRGLPDCLEKKVRVSVPPPG